MKNKSLLCLIHILFFGIGVCAQNVPEDLNDIFIKTLDSMHSVLKNKSLSVAVQLSDGSTWKRAAGISSYHPEEKATSDHLYLIGSVTKTITSASIVALAEEGQLSLDDKIVKWLEPIQYIDTNITIRQMLRHQSGIYDVLQSQAFNNEMNINQHKIFHPSYFVKKYIRPAIFAPGTQWSYSNTNYFLLGMIVEKVTGQPFYEYFRNKFYIPLQLNSIAIPSFEWMSDTIAHVWLDISGDGIPDDAHDYYINHIALNSMGGAAGGYYAKAEDLAKWMRSLMRGDLLSVAYMDEIKKTVHAAGVPQGSYGLGIMKKKFANVEAFGHGGDLGYSASSWYFPSLDISIAVLNNDGKFNSWTLVPVIEAFIRKYNQWTFTVSSIDEPYKLPNYRVYPNPFNSKLKIDEQIESINGEREVTLIDGNGKVVYKRKFANYHELINLDTSHLPENMYILKISNHEKTIYSQSLLKLNHE